MVGLYCFGGYFIEYIVIFFELVVGLFNVSVKFFVIYF